MFANINGIRISSIRTAVPAREVRIEDELEFYDNNPRKAQRAKKMIGTDCRRLAWPTQTASDLCQSAAKSLLDAHLEVKNAIDALIFVSQSPDYDLPATACILQNKLELPCECAAFDVNQGCAGYIYGIWLASSLINSGCKNVLLLAGDVPYRPRDRTNRVIAPIFGDGGSATLLQKDSNAPGIQFSIGTDGSGFEHIIVPAGRGRLPFFEKLEGNKPLMEDIQGSDGFFWQLFNTYMNGPEVFEFTLRVIPQHILNFLKRTRTDVNTLDYFILHQANRQIISEIARKAGLPLEKTPSETFSRYGNLSSASIPAALCDLFGSNGTTGKCRLLLSGYGVGLSWASCIWNADFCDCAPVLNIEAPDYEEISPQKQIEYWKKKIHGERNDKN